VIAFSGGEPASTSPENALEHDLRKVADFSEKIMRQNKKVMSAVDSTSSDRTLNWSRGVH
jgi:hypothetical protein